MEVYVLRKNQSLMQSLRVVLLALLFCLISLPAFADENQKAFSEFKDIIDKRYIYRDYKLSDWSALYLKYEAKLLGAANSDEFSRILNDLIIEIKDTHFWVFDSSGNQYASYRKEWNNSVNYNLDALPQIVKNYTELNPVIAKGQVSNVGYILIKRFFVDGDPKEAEYYAALSPLIDEFKKSTDGLIIDVRSNNGGNSRYGTDFAKHFIRSNILVGYNDHFSSKDPAREWVKVYDDPYYFRFDLSKQHYDKKVILLIGNNTGSSAENFTSEMSIAPNVKSIGDRTAGASGGPIAHMLSNGIKIMVPSVGSKGLDKVYVEGRGIEPDQYLPFIKDGSDNVLIEAFAQLGVIIEPEKPAPGPTPPSSGGCNSHSFSWLLLVLIGGTLLKHRREYQE